MFHITMQQEREKVLVCAKRERKSVCGRVYEIINFTEAVHTSRYRIHKTCQAHVTRNASYIFKFKLLYF